MRKISVSTLVISVLSFALNEMNLSLEFILNSIIGLNNMLRNKRKEKKTHRYVFSLIKSLKNKIPVVFSFANN